MDPVILTAAYLLGAKAMDGAAAEAGRSAWSGLEALAGRVREKLTGDRDAERALDAVEAASGDEGDVVVLSEHLRRHVESDPAFMDDLREAVATARDDGVTAIFVTEVRGSATVNKIVNIRTARDVSF